MYRRLVPLLVLFFFALAGLYAYRDPSPGRIFLSFPAGSQPTSDLALAADIFLKNLALLALCTGLIGAASFYPGRRPPIWVALVKAVAGVAAAVLAAGVVFQKAAAAGGAAAVLAAQTGKPPALIMLAVQIPHGLPEVLALLLVLTAPVFWLVRSLQVASLSRSTFEAWVEVRRLALPGTVLLGAAAIIEVYLTPLAASWLLR